MRFKWVGPDADLSWHARAEVMEALTLKRPTGSEEVTTRRPPVLLLVLALSAASVFLGYGAKVITGPFGDSHDGRNAGVWASASRALREEGPVRSRMGTRSPEYGTYASHPPLIVVETAAAEVIGAGSTIATRAPAWLGSLVSIGLLTTLLVRRGAHPTAVGMAVVLVAVTPMFLIYGTMLDTPVTSLPFGLGLLLAWERARDARPLPAVLAGGLAALAVLAGWQSFLLAGVIGVWALVRLMQAGEGLRRRPEVAFVAGGTVGAVLLVAWFLYAFGGTLRPLAGAYSSRTGGLGMPLLGFARAQEDYATATFGVVALLGLFGLVVALCRPETRGLAVLALAATVPYPLVFRSGAVNHDYWNYWFLLPLAVGLAAGADGLLGALSGHPGAPVMVVAVTGIVAATMALSAWIRPNAAAWGIKAGLVAGAVADNAVLPLEQRVTWFAGAIGTPPAWLGFATRRPTAPVALHDLPGWAVDHPDDLMFVGRGQCLSGEPHIAYSVESAAQVAARLPDVSLCRPQPRSPTSR